MNSKNPITGIILAGGKSSRMGVHKGFVRYKGIPFMTHIINKLQPLADDIIMVSDIEAYDIFCIKRIPDYIKDSGPLAGLYSGLQYSTTENNLVLSCDTPLINQLLLTTLINENTEDYDMIQFENQGKTTPLIALYKKRCAAACLALLNSEERRLQTLVNQINVKTIHLNHSLRKYTANINTPEELKRLNDEIKT